jgi:hypothetical protein
MFYKNRKVRKIIREADPIIMFDFNQANRLGEAEICQTQPLLK